MQTLLRRLDTVLDGFESEPLMRPEGRVVEVTGMMVKSVGPRASIGDMVWIETSGEKIRRRIPCEVVGFKDQHVLLMPVERLGGIRPGERVLSGERMCVGVGYSMIGRVVDGLGHPLDNGAPLHDLVPVDIERPAPPPMERRCLKGCVCDRCAGH